jgi:hypothetical protein
VAVENPELRVETPKMRVEKKFLVMEQFRQDPKSSLKDVSKLLQMPLSTLERIVADAVKKGELKHFGPKKGGFWEIINVP